MFRPALRALRHLAIVVFALSFVGASCGQTALGILPGVVNDPGNLTLRKAILGFATSSTCSEMLKRSIPIRTHDEEPSMGRFFPASCFAQSMPNGNLFLQFSGTGYLWTNATKRLTFEASGSFEFEQDFQMEGSTLYVYFRNAKANAVTFTPKVVESPATASMLGLPINLNAATLAQQYGPQLLKGEISRGFTVIRESDGTASFGLGLVAKGEHPLAPFLKASTGRTLLANDRAEIHQGQRDFAGPFEVTGDGRALWLTMSVDGAPGADVIVMPVATGQAWRDAYITQAATTAPPSPPNLDEQIVQGVILRRAVALPKGTYYVVLDNTATAGRTSPPANPNDDRAAAISYAVEEGGTP